MRGLADGPLTPKIPRPDTDNAVANVYGSDVRSNLKDYPDSLRTGAGGQIWLVAIATPHHVQIRRVHGAEEHLQQDLVMSRFRFLDLFQSQNLARLAYCSKDQCFQLPLSLLSWDVQSPLGLGVRHGPDGALIRLVPVSFPGTAADVQVRVGRIGKHHPRSFVAQRRWKTIGGRVEWP